ncbi:MAG: anhydro-N-acetylmuramic acid kinase [Chitinispirillales bacterium]|jgi:anhydro-N-acetylmuramic acid kinase|nr:anhydro-N-acetylmuramic acid kinase [Chitinispirillales bacterium]
MILTASPISKLKSRKKRRALAVSAGGLQSGIQALYLGLTNDDWEIYSTAFLPYPQKVADLMERFSEAQSPAALPDFGWLDYKISTLFVECAKNALAGAPKAIGEPHYATLNKPTLWKGETGEGLQQTNWDIPVGDELYAASALGIPVMSGFLRHNILAGGPGALPAFPGILAAARDTTGIGLFVNIGLVSRMAAVDKTAEKLLFESDIGPGTAIIDKCARATGCPEGFDRDGKAASQGTPNAECLEILSADQWIQKPAPKQAIPEIFTHLLSHPCLKPLNNTDRLATITALTAKSIYDFYRREYREPAQPETLWISGGGSNNLALADFLKASFDPIPVRSVEELNIPSDMMVPLTLGLTVDAFICGKSIPWETGDHPKIEPIGRWAMP